MQIKLYNCNEFNGKTDRHLNSITARKDHCCSRSNILTWVVWQIWFIDLNEERVFRVTECPYNYTVTFPAHAFVTRKVSATILQGYLWLLSLLRGEFEHVCPSPLYKQEQGPGKNHRTSPSNRHLVPNQREPSRKPASEHQPLLSVNICSQHDVENHSACSVSAAGWSTGAGRPLVRSQIMRPRVHPRCHLHLRRLTMEALLDKYRLVLQQDL